MSKYFKIIETQEWLVDPIESNHIGLIEIGKAEYDAGLKLKNNPPKTFDQELDSLNSKYDSDFTGLVSEYNRAVARDGVTESVKVDAVRSKMTTLDTEYDDAFMALLIKHS